MDSKVKHVCNGRRKIMNNANNVLKLYIYWWNLKYLSSFGIAQFTKVQ